MLKAAALNGAELSQRLVSFATLSPSNICETLVGWLDEKAVVLEASLLQV